MEGLAVRGDEFLCSDGADYKADFAWQAKVVTQVYPKRHELLVM